MFIDDHLDRLWEGAKVGGAAAPWGVGGHAVGKSAACPRARAHAEGGGLVV